MLLQLFLECGRPVELVEFDAVQGSYPPELGLFDGFIIPGSAATSCERTPWMLELEAFIRVLSEKRQKVLGICFGHQIVAQALGGKVERNLHTRTASVPFEFTSPEANLLAAADASVPAAFTEAKMLYHHNDVVVRLPEEHAVCLARSVANPADIVAYYEEKEGWATQRPYMVTMQAHPEFSTPLGVDVLKRIITQCEAAQHGDAWAQERLESIGEEGTHPFAITKTAIGLLWGDR